MSVRHTNDKQELTPALDTVAALPERLGTTNTLIADSGYFRETNVRACEAKEITPYIAPGREGHNRPLMERFSEPLPIPDDANVVTRMKHRLKTAAGKVVYATRKCRVEPLFGIIKEVMGFRSFLLRGFEAINDEWKLVCIAWNLKRLHVLTK